MSTSTQGSSQSPKQPGRYFFPADTVDGLLLPGEDSEVLLTDQGSAFWHRRSNWDQGQQTWQPDSMPAEAVRETSNGIRNLIQADINLRRLLVEIVKHLSDGNTQLPPMSVPQASPYEPHKTVLANKTEIMFPGGYFSDIAITFIKDASNSAVSWKQPSSSSISQSSQMPSDVANDAALVIERLLDLVTMMRNNLNALPHP